MMLWQLCRDFAAILDPAGAVDTGLNVMVLFIIVSHMVTCTIMRTAVFNAQDLQRLLQQRPAFAFSAIPYPLSPRALRSSQTPAAHPQGKTLAYRVPRR